MSNYGPYSQQTDMSTGPLPNKAPPDSQHKTNGPQPTPGTGLGKVGIDSASFVNGDPNNKSNQQAPPVTSPGGNNFDNRAQNSIAAQPGRSRQNSEYAPQIAFPMPQQDQAIQNSSVPPPVLPVGYRLEANTGNGQFPVPPPTGPAAAANAATPVMQAPYLRQATNLDPGQIPQNNLSTENLPPAVGVPAGARKNFNGSSLPPDIRRLSNQSFSPVSRVPEGMVLQSGSLPPSSAPPVMPTQQHLLPVGPMISAASEKQVLTAPPTGVPLGMAMHGRPPNSDPHAATRQNLPPEFSSPYPPNVFPMPIDRSNPSLVPMPQGHPVSGLSIMPMKSPPVPLTAPNGMYSIPGSHIPPLGALNSGHLNPVGQLLYNNQPHPPGPSPPMINSPSAQNNTQPPPGFHMPVYTPGVETKPPSSVDSTPGRPIQGVNSSENRGMDQPQHNIPKSLMVLNGKPMDLPHNSSNGALGNDKGLNEGTAPVIMNGQNGQVAHVVQPGAGPPLVFNNPSSAPQVVVEPPSAIPGAPAPGAPLPAHLPMLQPQLPGTSGPSHFPPVASENSTGPTVDSEQLIALADLNGVPRLPAENPNTTPLQKELEKLTAQTWADLAKLSRNVGHHNASIECLKNAVKFHLATPEIYLMLGDCYQHLNACESAVVCYQMVIKEEPNNGEAWAEISYCYLNLNNLEKAYQSYQQALYHLDGNDPKLCYGIGTLYDRYGSLECAKAAFLQVLKVSENRKRFDKIPEVYFRLGLIFKQLRKFDLALKSFYYILNDPPKPLKVSDIWFQIGNVFEEQENIKGACNAYLEVLKENTGHYKVLQQLGWLYYQQNELDEALKYLNRSLELDPAESQSWYLVGRCHMSAKRYQKAYEAYQQAVYRDSRNPTFWCSIGVLYYQISQYRDALDAYSRAISLNPYISEAWYDLGMLYESCNNHTSDALYAYQRAARLDPSNTHITKRISQLETTVPNKPANNSVMPMANRGHTGTSTDSTTNLDKLEVCHPPLGNHNPPRNGSIESFSGAPRVGQHSSSSASGSNFTVQASPGGSVVVESLLPDVSRNNNTDHANHLPAVTQPIVPPPSGPPTESNSSHNGPSSILGSQEQAKLPNNTVELRSLGEHAVEPVLPPPVRGQAATPPPPQQTEEARTINNTGRSNTATSSIPDSPKDTLPPNSLGTKTPDTHGNTGANQRSEIPEPGRASQDKNKQIKLPPNFQMLHPISKIPEECVITSPRSSQVIDTSSGTEVYNRNEAAKDSEVTSSNGNPAQPAQSVHSTEHAQPARPIQPAEHPEKAEPLSSAPVESRSIQDVRASSPAKLENTKLENTHVPQNDHATSQKEKHNKDNLARSSPRIEVEKPHLPSCDFSKSEDGVRRSQEFQPLQQSQGRWEPLQAQGETDQSKKQESAPAGISDSQQSAKRTASGSGSPTKRRMIAEDEDYD